MSWSRRAIALGADPNIAREHEASLRRMATLARRGFPAQPLVLASAPNARKRRVRRKRMIRTLGLILALVSCFAGGASAQQYPSRTVRVVVAAPPGGLTDIVA